MPFDTYYARFAGKTVRFGEIPFNALEASQAVTDRVRLNPDERFKDEFVSIEKAVTENYPNVASQARLFTVDIQAVLASQAAAGVVQTDAVQQVQQQLAALTQDRR